MRSVVMWALMIAAMMFPLLGPMIGHVAVRSFAARRERSIGLFVAGYALTWLAAAALASVALVVARAGLSALGLAASAGLIGCGLAALWQVSSAKGRAVNRCHGTIALRPFGWAADRDAMRFGLLHGSRCVRACLATMVLPLAGGHGVGAMAVVFAILLAERARQFPQYALSALALVMLGLTTLV
jgi:predicted metal-binding membrane protein